MKKAMLLILVTIYTSACDTASTSSVLTLFPTDTITQVPNISFNRSTIPSSTFSSTPTSTPVFFEGKLTIKVNIRSGPGTSYESLGQMDAGDTVQIQYISADKSWYRVSFPSASQGYGWVSAQYANLAEGVSVPYEANPAGLIGILTQPVNVRSGPGTAFETLAVLEIGTRLILTGKNTTSSWFQVVYPPGTDEHGWVTSQYVQTEVSGSLPVLDDLGNPVSIQSGTPAGPYISPTPTAGPAMDDGDSADHPGVDVAFSGSGTDRFIYSSQVSSPEGDLEDWVAFTPYAPGSGEATMYLSLACSRDSSLNVELYQGNELLTDWGTLSCGIQHLPVLLPANRAYLMHLAARQGDQPNLVAYTLTIQNTY